MPEQDFCREIDDCRRRALALGALAPIETCSESVEDQERHFIVRWLSSLTRKRASRADDQTRGSNPFLPADTRLQLCALGSTHIALLNKYPVMERHLLVVTRDFRPQSAALEAEDLAALAVLLERGGGLGFFNGGPTAGASQPHRHLQWVPRQDGELPLLADLDRAPGQGRNAIAWLRFDHAFARLDTEVSLAAAFEMAYRRLAAMLDFDLSADPLPAYNLLVTPRWMLMVARSAEHWRGLSVNALGFAGSLFVPDAARIAELRDAGALSILAAVSRPQP